jgi:cation diffusion facilitator family transporter
MKAFTHWLVRHLIADYRDVDNLKVRAKYGSLEAWVSIFINVALFAIKCILALIVHSVSLLADAIHTLSDTGTSIVILIGFKIAKRPADREHPFGHGRMESVATLIVSVLLIVTGFELLRSSFERILHPKVMSGQIGPVLVVIIVGTILIKELLARFARELSVMAKSKTLEADFWHHRSDALSTVLVLVAMAGSYYGYNYIDGVMGMGVALIVMYSGYVIARDAISPLLGEKPKEELIREIETLSRRVPGVLGVHDVIVHRYGQVNLISLHVEVSADEPIEKLHDISEQVEAILDRNLGGTAVAHIDPLSRSHPRYDEIHGLLKQTVAENNQILSFHDLRITGENPVRMSFDITLEQIVAQEQVVQLKETLIAQLQGQLRDVEIEIKAEPRYAYTN